MNVVPTKKLFLKEGLDNDRDQECRISDRCMAIWSQVMA